MIFLELMPTPFVRAHCEGTLSREVSPKPHTDVIAGYDDNYPLILPGVQVPTASIRARRPVHALVVTDGSRIPSQSSFAP